jgi:hypothetical protein
MSPLRRKAEAVAKDILISIPTLWLVLPLVAIVCYLWWRLCRWLLNLINDKVKEIGQKQINRRLQRHDEPDGLS